MWEETVLSRVFYQIIKFVRRNYKFLGVALAVVLLIILVVSGVFDNENANSSNNSASIEYIDDVTDTRVASPEIEAPQTIDLSDGDIYRNIAKGYQFKIPSGYTLYQSGNVLYLRDKDLTTQICFIFTGISLDTKEAVWDNVYAYASRTTGLFNGEEIPVINYAETHQENATIGNLDCLKEKGILEFHKSGGDLYSMDEYAYITTFTPSEYGKEESDTKGIICYSFSSVKSADDLYADMEALLLSLETCLPTEEELSPSLQLTTYQSPKEDMTKFQYPADWDVKQNSDGMIIISAPADRQNPFYGTVIEFFADSNNAIVDDYAQFSSNYEVETLKPMFCQSVSDTDFSVLQSITDMDLEKKIGEKKCIYYDIKDTIRPNSRGVANSLITDVLTVNCQRYTFKANGIDCMFNCIVPNAYSQIIVDEIIESLEIY